MKRYRLQNCETGATIGYVTRAGNAIDRTIGLLRTRRVPAGQGMWFDGCGAIHTFLMGCAIDIVFLDSDSRVLHIESRVSPNQIVVAPGARMTVELGAGTAQAAKLRCGNRIALEEDGAPP